MLFKNSTNFDYVVNLLTELNNWKATEEFSETELTLFFD